MFPVALLFNLLLSDVYKRLTTNPEYLRETILAQHKKQVIIDEIQRIPILLNEVQWLIVNHNIQFILSGSSPRKILRSGENLLGGRALKYSLYPLTYAEIPNFDLERALNHGLLPRHYLFLIFWEHLDNGMELSTIRIIHFSFSWIKIAIYFS